MNKKDIEKKLKEVLKREERVSTFRLGIPQPPKPENHFTKETALFLKLNPNNIGTPTRMKISKNSCRGLEKDLIEKVAKWTKFGDSDGYMASGSTEGNIMGVWIGRESLRDKKRPVVMAHSESHHSISKACDLLNLRLITTPKDCWQKPLDKKILVKITKNIKSPLIIIATLGHTSTGIIDNVKSILSFIKSSKNNCYLHIDAAIGGLIIPFLRPKDFSLLDNRIKSLALDFHKYGFSYYPSGAFLCRKGMQDKISNSGFKYIGLTDDTLIGSRSGIIPAITWANTMLLGKNGFSDRAKNVMANKELFIKRLTKKNIPHFSEKYSPVVCLFVTSPLSSQIENKFRIKGRKTDKGYLYAVFFYPQYYDSYNQLINCL